MIASLIGTLLTVSPSPVVASVAMITTHDIDQACDAAESYAEKNQSKGQIVADISDGVLPRKGEGRWKVFKRARDMEGFGEDGAPNTQARVWRTPNGITFVDAFYTSGSGDWAHLLASCYRPDGTLARSRSTYNTFLTDTEDGVRRIRTRHYDPKGMISDTTRKVLNLRTGKPSPKARFGDAEEPVAIRLKDLPFWALVEDGLAKPMKCE